MENFTKEILSQAAKDKEPNNGYISNDDNLNDDNLNEDE